MKVRELRCAHGANQEMEVLGAYCINNELYFYCIPNGYKGLLAYKECDVEITDSTLGRDLFFERRSGSFGFFHPALLEDGMESKLLELDSNAYDSFKSLLG